MVFFLFFIIIILFGKVAAGETSLESIRNHVKHASTYFYFGMAEKGNMEALRNGLMYLDKAEKLLKSESFSQETADELNREINALRVDFKNQGEVHFDTLYGVFPLIRLLVPSLFADALSTGTFELADDPAVMAATSAGTDLCEKVILKWRGSPQLNVVFNSVPKDKALENELLYIFNLSAKFFVHNFHEVVSALSPGQIEKFQADQITPEIKKRLCKIFKISDILVVSVRLLDVVKNDHFYIVEGKVYNVNKDEPTHFFSNMGFSRGRSAQLWSIILSNIILLIFALIVFSTLTLWRESQLPPFPVLIIVPAVGFLVGRTVPWALVSMLSTIAPRPETLAKLSFWWPCTVGGVLFLTPALFYRIGSVRMRNISSIFDMEGKGGAVFSVIALGVCAYLAGPLFLFLEGKAVGVLVPLVLAGSITLYILGRTLDPIDPFPPYVMVAPLIIVLCLGAATLHLKLIYIWLCTGISLISLALATIRVLKIAPDEFGTETTKFLGQLPADTHELVKRTEFPPYKGFKSYAEAFNQVETVMQGRTVWLGLTGPTGVGKTATANAVISGLQDKIRESGNDMITLKGDCPEYKAEEMGEAKPYNPFQKALARYFGVDIFAPPEEQLLLIDSALEGIFSSAIPFAGLLFPPADNISNRASNKKEVFLSIEKTIRKLAEKKTVVFFIDDIHWIDEASSELLSFLLGRFPAGENTPLFILLTSRNINLVRSFTKNHIIVMEELGEKQLAELLATSLGLKREVARTVVGKVGKGTAEKGGLFWLFRVVAYLAGKGFFKKTEKGFTWSEQYKGTDNLPIPDDFQAALEEQLNKVPQYRSLLECATCLGLELSAEILAESISVPRLELLQALDRIEDETGILYDVRESDDVYAFSSSFMLEILRKKMRISERGPKAKDVPQLIREYHARVAASLEKTLKRSSTKLYEVAKHYYASGANHAEKGLEYCLKAAHTARNEFLYDQARHYVDMAGECAEVLKRDVEMEQEYFLINCDEAHVVGIHRDETAQEGLSYIERYPDVPNEVLIAVARACYEAGADSGDQNHFEEAVRIGRLIIERAKTPFEQAEGYHFIGISLPTNQHRKRDENLRKAINILKTFSENDIQGQALLARIQNSMAEQLSYGSLEAKAEAEELFWKSIETKIRPELYDRPGLARSYGGLGRLAYFADSPDISTARIYFEIDLCFSEQLEDRTGRTKMHSFIGACDKAENKIDDAINHYQIAFDMAEGSIDKIYSAIGLIECYSVKGQKDEINNLGENLLSLAKEKGIPKSCASPILKIIKDCKDQKAEKWFEKLEAIAIKVVGER